ncbi:MAG TPA: hypothetical protein VNL77_02980 [Roseiflexaceae bacterium]|nr:hypothetical protein [Roseiflexaceae bacterium]
MTGRRTHLLVPLTVLLLAMLAMTPMATSAAGTIIDNRITSATIDPVTSVATLGGAIQCSVPTQVTVYAWARQFRSANGPFAEYFGGTEVTCGPTPTSYTVTVTPGYQSDRLVPGPASVGFWAEYCTSTGCHGLNSERDMRLLPRR